MKFCTAIIYYFLSILTCINIQASSTLPSKAKVFAQAEQMSLKLGRSEASSFFWMRMKKMEEVLLPMNFLKL